MNKYHTGPWVSKYSASGTWNGELVEGFDTVDECKEFLKELAARRENEGRLLKRAGDRAEKDAE